MAEWYKPSWYHTQMGSKGSALGPDWGARAGSGCRCWKGVGVWRIRCTAQPESLAPERHWRQCYPATRPTVRERCQSQCADPARPSWRRPSALTWHTAVLSMPFSRHLSYYGCRWATGGLQYPCVARSPRAARACLGRRPPTLAAARCCRQGRYSAAPLRTRNLILKSRLSFPRRTALWQLETCTAMLTRCRAV